MRMIEMSGLTRIVYGLIVFMVITGGAFPSVVASVDDTSDWVRYRNPLQVQIRDPFILEYNDVYYLYGTTSADTGFMAYASTDLVQWAGPVTVYRRPADAVWNQKDFWAPEVVERDGRFYMFYTAHNDQDRLGIGVAVSDSPLGPFTDATNHAITPPNWDTLDAHVYIDQEGTAYLLYTHSWTQAGAGSLYIQRLADDWFSVVGKPTMLASAADPAWNAGYLGRVIEAPSLIHHEDQYYLMYSSFVHDEYGVGYAVAPSLFGPYEHKEQVLFDDSGHNDVFVGPDGQYYVAYHSPNASAPFMLHIDRLFFDSNGALHVNQTRGELNVIEWPNDPAK